MWRGRVMSAIRGKRGQALLESCLIALDVMPEKRLISDLLVDNNEVCLLGAACLQRGVADLGKIDPEDHHTLSQRLNVAECLIREIEYENDEGACFAETPEQRFDRMRKWVVKNLKDGAK